MSNELTEKNTALALHRVLVGNATTSQPLVTVIIPSYNHERYIEQAILSVVTQTYKEIQLIVIDDGSKDGSLEVISGLAKLHGFEVVARENRGLSKTLNEGIALARGQFICFLASDDFYLPTRVELAVSQFNTSATNVVAVCCDGNFVNADGHVIYKFSDRYPRPIIGTLFQNLNILNFLPAMGMTYKLDVLRRFMFDEKYKFEDYTLYLRLFSESSNKLSLYSAMGFGYRWHGSNTSANALVINAEIDKMRSDFKILGEYYDFKQSLMGRRAINLSNVTFGNILLLLVDMSGKLQRKIIGFRNRSSAGKNQNVRNNNSPNFFVVGAAKSGTSSIAKYLEAHPDIYVSPIKEPHHFSEDILLSECGNKYRRRTAIDVAAYLHQKTLLPMHIAHIDNRAQYLALYGEVLNQTAIGELSTGYLYSSNAAKNIFDFNKSAKIVIVLRQPVRRAYSHYLMNLRDGWDSASGFMVGVLRDYAQQNKGWGKSNLYVELGLYFEQVKRYVELFPKEQVKVFLFDDLCADPEKFMRDLYKFLDVDASFLNPQALLGNKNAAALPKSGLILKSMPMIYSINSHFGRLIPSVLKAKVKSFLFTRKNLPKLSQQEFDELMCYFTDDIKKLSVLIGRDLSNWYTYSPSAQRKVDGGQIAN